MDIQGERVLPVPRQVVWDSLFDTAVLQQSVPGCESAVRESDTVYRIVTMLAIGPLKVRFNGTLTIADAQAPETCILQFQGQGGAAGMAKGTAQVRLQDTAEGTLLTYSADAQISGKLAQVGSRLIESVAKKLSGVFFDNFEAALAPPLGQVRTA
jgi:carbon monoxide dehydrogenase subunit G